MYEWYNTNNIITNLKGPCSKRRANVPAKKMHLTTSLWLHKIRKVLNYFLESTAVLEFFNDILFSQVLNWSDMLAQNTLYP